jgi:hypothetical protein
MIFYGTSKWITDVSPYTGKPKTQDRRIQMSDPEAKLLFLPEHSSEYRPVGQYQHGAEFFGVKVVSERSGFAIEIKRGRHYGIQDKRTVLDETRVMIRIERIRYQHELGGISEEDARAEGYVSVKRCLEAYANRFGRQVLELSTFALTFRVVSREEAFMARTKGTSSRDQLPF